MNKTVSVIVTCYNLEKYLKECIESIHAQTVRPDEIIVVHDGCSNPTMFTNSEYYIKEKNTGVCKSRDEGFKLSSGEYILFVDGDDVLPENYIEQMLELMPKYDIAYPSILLWSRWGDEAPLDNAWYEPSNKINMKGMMRVNSVVVSAMMKREVYETVGMFDVSLPIFEDWDFWIRALLRGFKFKKARTFLKYRQRTGGRNQGKHELKVKICKIVQQRYEQKNDK